MLRRSLVVLLACACGKSADPSATRELTTAECTAAANEVGKFLTTMDRDTMLDLAGVEPVVRDDLPAEPRLREAPLVYITATGALRLRDVVMNRNELMTALTTANKEIRTAITDGRFPRNDPPDPRRMILVIDRRATWQDVVVALDAATRGGFTLIDFVFGRPPSTPPPPRTRVDDEIDTLKPDADGNMSGVLAKYTGPKIKACPTLVTAFGNVSGATTADPTQTLLAAVGPALIECHCAVDPAEIRSLFWRVTGNPHPLRIIQVSLDMNAKPFAVVQTTKWSDVAKQFAVVGKPTWFDLE